MLKAASGETLLSRLETQQRGDLIVVCIIGRLLNNQFLR